MCIRLLLRHMLAPARNLSSSAARAGVDKVICLGKNYLEHAKELGDAVPDKPVLFNKPFSACVCATSSGDAVNVSLPTGRGVVHFETEIVLQVGPRQTISDVTLGLDLTLRDVQKGLKQNGHPWEIGKVFPGSAVIGPWHSLANAEYLEQEFTLHIDGQLRQKGVGRDMRLKPMDTIQFIQQYYDVCEGDLIFTGTPAVESIVPRWAGITIIIWPQGIVHWRPGHAEAMHNPICIHNRHYKTLAAHAGVGPIQNGQTAQLAWSNLLSYSVKFEGKA